MEYLFRVLSFRLPWGYCVNGNTAFLTKCLLYLSNTSTDCHMFFFFIGHRSSHGQIPNFIFVPTFEGSEINNTWAIPTAPSMERSPAAERALMDRYLTNMLWDGIYHHNFTYEENEVQGRYVNWPKSYSQSVTEAEPRYPSSQSCVLMTR